MMIEVLPANRDRGLCYGDGLFETLRLNHRGEAPLWPWHKKRLAMGLERFRFPDGALVEIEAALTQHLTLNDAHLGLKLTVTRGEGARGYPIPENPKLTVSFDRFTPPDWFSDRGRAGLRLSVCDVRLGLQPQLAGIKHLGRMEQVLGRYSVPETCDDGLMLDMSDHVIESTCANIVFCEGDQWFTPSTHGCGIDGVTRAWLAQRIDVNRVEHVSIERLLNADGVWLTNSMLGIAPVESIVHDQNLVKYSPNHALIESQQSLKSLFL